MKSPKLAEEIRDYLIETLRLQGHSPELRIATINETIHYHATDGTKIKIGYDASMFCGVVDPLNERCGTKVHGLMVSLNYKTTALDFLHTLDQLAG